MPVFKRACRSGQGLLTPAKLPADIVIKLGVEVRRILTLPDVKENLASQGTTPLILTQPEMATFLALERERWAKVIKDSGFKLG